MSQNIDLHKKLTIITSGLLVLAASVSPADAQVRVSKRPALIITNDTMPAANPPQPVYARPSIAPKVEPQQLIGPGYYQPTETIAARKIAELRSDLFALNSTSLRLADQLRGIEVRNQSLSSEYFANTATINTQLQSGTTPGNPRLIQRLTNAQMNLDSLAENVAELNTLAVQVSNAASLASFLLEAARATYNLSGAVEEDHVVLSKLEDDINNMIVTIDRILNGVNDNITRIAAYLSAERSNLRTLSLAISNGDLYGPNLGNRPFASVPLTTIMQPASFDATGIPAVAVQLTRPTEPRVLAKIRFDRENVDYEQPVYIAMNEALQKYPDARFELIAVHPTTGNAAQMAIESTRARRNAEQVLRSVSQMGVPADKIDLSYNADPEARSNEVHIYVR